MKDAKEKVWKGRVDADRSSVRFHQQVECQRIEGIHPNRQEKAFGLIGFASDEGVRRNQGRIGAAQAPDNIRSFLGSLPYHHPENKMIDVGNITCVDGALEHAQAALGKGVFQLLEKHYIPIIIGGGHETVYGHYLGVREFAGPNPSIGIINIDAHFDLRDEETASSGTMFSQIFASGDRVGYLCLGIQKLGNTKALFDAAERVGCTYVFAEDVARDETFEVIDHFASDHDIVILTLCSDAIASSSAPGVSAPSPYGLDPHTVRTLIRYIVAKDTTMSFDLSEVNPLVDESDQTSRLAAFLLAEAITGFSGKKE